MLSFASANRDEEVFPDPHRFDIRRSNARKQLTFGNGVHFCLGAPLARLEMKIVFEEFAKRFRREARVTARVEGTGAASDSDTGTGASESGTVTSSSKLASSPAAV